MREHLIYSSYSWGSTSFTLLIHEGAPYLLILFMREPLIYSSYSWGSTSFTHLLILFMNKYLIELIYLSYSWVRPSFISFTNFFFFEAAGKCNVKRKYKTGNIKSQNTTTWNIKNRFPPSQQCILWSALFLMKGVF